MKPIRVYADTSVFGGVYDDEFRQPSLTFFEQVKNGQFVLVTSAVVQDEMVAAPPTVRHFFEEMLGFAEVADITESALDLRDAYLQAKIVTSRYSDDALHVALATMAGCALIVSWNFQHIVHFQKIPLYNAMNTLRGYQQIAIFSPREVIRYEDQAVRLCTDEASGCGESARADDRFDQRAGVGSLAGAIKSTASAPSSTQSPHQPGSRLTGAST